MTANLNIKAYLCHIPAPLSVFWILCESPHVKPGFNSFWTQYVILFILPNRFCLSVGIKAECLWTKMSCYNKQQMVWSDHSGSVACHSFKWATNIYLYLLVEIRFSTNKTKPLGSVDLWMNCRSSPTGCFYLREFLFSHSCLKDLGFSQFSQTRNTKNENAWALTRPPATYPCQHSCPIDLLTQTFHTLQQLIMTDRQRPFNYPNDVTLWHNHAVMSWMSRRDVMDVKTWRQGVMPDSSIWNDKVNLHL